MLKATEQGREGVNAGVGGGEGAKRIVGAPLYVAPWAPGKYPVRVSLNTDLK